MRMKSTPGIYQRLASSIAPTVYGHDEIKKGLLLMCAARNPARKSGARFGAQFGAQFGANA